MFLTLSKKNTLAFIVTIIIASSAFFLSCQKEFSGNGIEIENELPDLTTKIASSVSGFVTDENEAAVNGATVVFGSSTTTTDKFGYFEVRNVQVIKKAAVVTIIKPGYFKGIKTYIATEGKSAFFRIKLLPKIIAGNIDAAAGGTATLANGLSISLPAGAVVNAATNAAYTGSVTVAAQWLNPAANDLYRIMPGDLRGLDSLNVMRLLITYGMAAVELTGTSGELLQIAAGKKATVNFPLPSAIAATAPATVPLWYFDETKGLWKQDGNAVKSGNNYVGAVSHFSFWNCDVSVNYVHFDCTVTDASGSPVANTMVKISVVGNTQNQAYGYTDSSGYTGGFVPDHSQLLLEVFSDNPCLGSVISQNFTTSNASVSLGNIQIATASIANIAGNVTDCNNAPVTDGYVILQYRDRNSRTIIKPDGTFSLNTLICTTNIDVNIIVINNAALEQSNALAVTLVSGNNNVGMLNACGTSAEEFINYSINGSNYSLTAPADSFTHSANQDLGSVFGVSYSGGVITHTASFIFNPSNISAGSIQNLINFGSTHINDSTAILNSIPINITEYGSVGQFISGNFTGILTSAPPANTPYNITCNFRVRRSQ
jgi:hypothetical protein